MKNSKLTTPLPRKHHASLSFTRNWAGPVNSRVRAKQSAATPQRRTMTPEELNPRLAHVAAEQAHEAPETARGEYGDGYVYSYFSSHQPAYKLVEGYIGYGEKDARQHVGYAQALVPEPEEVYGQAEQEHPAHGGHFSYDGLGEVRR